MSQHLFGLAAGRGIRRIILATACVLAPVSASLAAEHPIPSCSLNLGSGQPAGFESFRGKVLYVDFWASWCVPCLLSFPFMSDLQKTDGPRGLQVIAVNMDERPADAAAFLVKHPADFAVAVGPNADCAKAFGVAAMPTSFLVGRDGSIHSVHPGFRPGDADPLRAEVEALLAEGAGR